MKLFAAVCAAAIVGSCFVDKVTDDFECGSQADCTDGRVCEQGFCVQPTEPACNALCNGGCDPIGMTCAISCSTAGQCGGVECPSGFDCSISCNAGSACSNIDCSNARSCNISCSAPNACGSIDCGGAARCSLSCNASNACDSVDCGSSDCDVACVTNNSCGIVDCSSACACDVQCATGACTATQCPMGTLMMCTVDGTTATTCSSTAQAGCLNCP